LMPRRPYRGNVVVQLEIEGHSFDQLRKSPAPTARWACPGETRADSRKMIQKLMKSPAAQCSSGPAANE
jgi:hypothetical protein